MLSFLFLLMDKILFPFKGLHARSLGPISCLAVPSSAIGPVITLRGVVFRDRFAATCFLLSVNDGLHCPLKTFFHICETSLSLDLQASRLDKRLQTCCSRLQYVSSMSTTCS